MKLWATGSSCVSAYFPLSVLLEALGPVDMLVETPALNKTEIVQHSHLRLSWVENSSVPGIDTLFSVIQIEDYICSLPWLSRAPQFLHIKYPEVQCDQSCLVKCSSLYP